MGVTHYITVTTTSIERIARRTGIPIKRIGPPIRIGIANAVALGFDLDKQKRMTYYSEKYLRLRNFNSASTRPGFVWPTILTNSITESEFVNSSSCISLTM